jgi:hypothetical protein
MHNGKSAILWQALCEAMLATSKASESRNSCKEGAMKKYMIEREIPKVGTLQGQQLREAAAKSNQVLRQLGPRIQWLESYLTADKMYCLYLAEDEAVIQQHADLSGFPATKISEIGRRIDPTTAEQR